MLYIGTYVYITTVNENTCCIETLVDHIYVFFSEQREFGGGNIIYISIRTIIDILLYQTPTLGGPRITHACIHTRHTLTLVNRRVT